MRGALVVLLALLLLAGCIGGKADKKGFSVALEVDKGNDTGVIGNETSDNGGGSNGAVEGNVSHEGGSIGSNRSQGGEERMEGGNTSPNNSSNGSPVYEEDTGGYRPIGKEVGFGDPPLAILLDGLKGKGPSSELIVNITYRESYGKPIELNIEDAWAEGMGVKVEGEGDSIILQPGEEGSITIHYPMHRDYIERVAFTLHYRIRLSEREAQAGYINVSAELGRVALGHNTYIYIPKQCEEEPWGDDPAAYYRKKGVRVVKVEREQFAEVVCMACHVCPKGYVWKVYVEGNAEPLEEDGWKRE